MTVLYSNDFEAASTGDQSEWPMLAGNRLQVLGALGPGTPARGTKGFGRNNDGDASYWNGNTSLTDTAIRSAQKLNTGMGSHISHLHRASTVSSDAYIRFRVSLTSTTATAIIDVRNTGAVALATAAGSLSITAGDTLHMESSSVGTLHSFRIWKNSESRPASPSVTLTDATHSSGVAGLRKVGSFEITLTDDVVITDAAGGEDFFYATGMVGTITLDAFTLSGDMATGALSQLSSGFTLDTFAMSGFLGLAPGRIDSNPFKNWTGTLLPGITIPRLTFLRLSDMTTVLQLTNQVTAGDGVLTVTNAAFTPGTTYLVVAASVDGTSLGAEIYTAT